MPVSITKGLAVLAAVVLVLGAVGRTSGEIIIDQNTTIDYTTEEDVHIVQGADPPTVVDVVAPASLYGHTRAFDSSILNVTSGDAEFIYAHDSSVVNYTSSEWCSSVETYDVSTANLSGGINDLFAYGTSTVNVTGDSMGEIWAACDSSTMNVFGGTSDHLQARDSSRVNISGGSFWPAASESATITITGGTIGGLSAGNDWGGPHDCVITVAGSGFNYPYGPIPDAAGTLTGMLANGDSISAGFGIYRNASIVLVPEPSTFVLLSIGAATLAFSVWRRQLISTARECRGLRIQTSQGPDRLDHAQKT